MLRRGAVVTGGAHHWDGVHAGKEPPETSWFEGEPTVDLDAVDILTVHQAKGLEPVRGDPHDLQAILVRGLRRERSQHEHGAQRRGRSLYQQQHLVQADRTDYNCHLH